MSHSEDSAVERALRNSRVAQAFDLPPNSLRRSVFVRSVQAFGRSAEHSRLNAATERLADVARSSFLYRWLTSEPDPDIVVIDLRETWTVGPFVTVLDRIGNWIGQYWRGATSRTLLERGADVAEQSVALKTLAAVLEPPEPPADEADRDASERNP